MIWLMPEIVDPDIRELWTRSVRLLVVIELEMFTCNYTLESGHG